MNAKEELLTMLGYVKRKYNAEILCAVIDFGDKAINLNQGYDAEEFNEFLNNLDFNYNNGFGGQLLFGKVWLTNNVWLDRGEYDGSEWWEHYKYPEIPDDVKATKFLNL